MKNKIKCRLKFYGLKYLIPYIIASLFRIKKLYSWISYHVFRDSYYKKTLESKVSSWYEINTGKKINIKNPKTYDEKIQWMKLYDATPEKTRLTDKLLAKEYIAEKIGENHVPKTILVSENLDELIDTWIDTDTYIKSNHSCNMYIPTYKQVKNKYKNKVNAKKKIKKTITKWIKTNYAFCFGEMQYLNIKPKIYLEEQINLSSAKTDKSEIKIFCYGGQPKIIGYFLSDEKKYEYMDTSWNKNVDVFSEYKIWNIQCTKPKNYENMLEASKKLSEGIPYVRIDFLNTDSDFYIGELTFSQNAGIGYYASDKANKYFGKLIKLPEKSPIPILNR